MVIAITGGLGCGKSTVAKLFEECGFQAIDSDGIVKDLLEKDASIIKAVEEHFGKRVFTKDGVIDRKAIATVVFADKEELSWLEEHLHPKVLAIIDETVKGEPEGKWVVEIPLLFEKKLEKGFDYTICVSANAGVQLARLADKGLDAEEARRRIAHQMPQSAKEEHADYVILNNGSIEFLREQIVLLVQQLS